MRLLASIAFALVCIGSMGSRALAASPAAHAQPAHVSAASHHAARRHPVLSGARKLGSRVARGARKAWSLTTHTAKHAAGLMTGGGHPKSSAHAPAGSRSPASPRSP